MKRAASGYNSAVVVRRLRLRVLGRVQGVGFRHFAASAARRLGVVGHVRNELDGSVTLEAEGEEAAIELLLGQVRRGPPHAAVAEVVVEDLPQHGGLGNFEIER